MVDPFLANLRKADVQARGRVALLNIDVGSVLPVYAYRTTVGVHLIVPRGFNDASDAFNDDPRVGMRTGCGFLHLFLTAPEGMVQ